MASEIKAVFFDIGGVLVHKANYAKRDQTVIAKMVELLGANCTSTELEGQILQGDRQYKSWRSLTYIELSPEDRWTRFLLADMPEALVRQHAAQLQTLWSESRGVKKVPKETVSTLTELDKRGYFLGTISHTSPKYLAPYGVLPLFKTIIHSSQYGWRKPHPAPFLEAARRSGMLPGECAYVGDRPSRDVIGAREAGFGMVIQLALSSEPPEVEPCPMWPDAILHHLSELLDIFPSLKSNKSSSTQKPELLLYDAAISSMWWNRPQMPADEFCVKARTLGFARIELNHQVPPEALAELDLGHYHIGSLHDPCPAVIPNKTLERADQVITSLDEERRERAVDGVKNTILEAYNLGARHVVIHPGRVVGDHSMDDQLRELYRSGLKGTPQYEELRIRLMDDRAERAKPHLKQLIKSLWDIVTYSDGKSLTIGLENRYHYYELPIFDELQVLLDEFQQPWVGWHYDVGHLQTLQELGLTEEEPWFTQFGKRITGVHLHDVRGITDHQAPGMGEMDFRKIAAVLPPYCYRTVEVDKKVNMDDMAAGLELLSQSGCITQLSGGENHV